MTIRFVEGFDNQGPQQLAQFGKWYSISIFASSGSGATMSLVSGRYGGSAWHVDCRAGTNGSAAALGIIDLRSNLSTVFIGFAFNDQGTAGVADPRVFQLIDQNSTVFLDMFINASHFPAVRRQSGNTTLLTTSQPTPIGSWFYMEFGCFISATAGWFEVRQEGVLVGSYYGTGTSRGTANGNTQGSGTGVLRYVQFGTAVSFGNAIGSALGSTFHMDDLVICDNAGSFNNDFIGEARVIGLLPNAVGTNTNMTRVGGTASGNFTAVNENPVDGDTSYVASAVPGTLDTYRFPTLPASASSVLAVVGEPVSRRDDAGVRTLTSHIRSGGTEVDFPGATILLPVAYTTVEQVMETNPATSIAWTVADVNAVEAGPIVKS